MHADECDCTSCTTDPLPFTDSPPLALCEPATCPNGKCNATGQCQDSKPHRLVIGFWSPVMGSGKSTAAKRLIESHGYERGKFAGALKEMLRTFLRYRGVDAATIERMVEGDLKETPAGQLGYHTPRHAMQTLGTEWGRQCLYDSLWVETELEAKRDVPKLVFDDVRYPNEAAAIKAAGGFVVAIDRPGAELTNGHQSEGQPIDFDFLLLNHGTETEFVTLVDEIARNLSWTVAALNDR